MRLIRGQIRKRRALPEAVRGGRDAAAWGENRWLTVAFRWLREECFPIHRQLGCSKLGSWRAAQLRAGGAAAAGTSLGGHAYSTARCARLWGLKVGRWLIQGCSANLSA